MAVDYVTGDLYYTAVKIGQGGFVGVGLLTPNGQHRMLYSYGKQPRAIALDLKRR